MMVPTRSRAGHRLRAIASLLMVAAASFVGDLHAQPARVLKVDFENPALPARQKELLARYADEIVDWAATPQVVRAAQEQSANAQPLERIKEIDRAWQSGGDPQGLVTRLSGNDCAKALQSLLQTNRGFGEAFVTDSKGALVCMTKRTSDYWQGDEAKWTRAWAGGTGAIFVSKVAHDDSTGLDLMHISAPVRAAGRLVGVLTVGRLLGGDVSRAENGGTH
jgi:hypothetical protein